MTSSSLSTYSKRSVLDFHFQKAKRFRILLESAPGSLLLGGSGRWTVFLIRATRRTTTHVRLGDDLQQPLDPAAIYTEKKREEMGG